MHYNYFKLIKQSSVINQFPKMIKLISLYNLIFFLPTMKNFQKHIRFENIILKLDEQQPKEISRVYFQLKTSDNLIHKIKKYGTISTNSIKFQSPLQFPYKAQQSFKFQTLCEHEYGYQIHDLKAIFSGQIIIKPEDFFVTNYSPLYNKQGKKCGHLSFLVKVIDRQVGVDYNQQDQVDTQERIKVDLIAKISFLQAYLSINSLFVKDFEGKKSFSIKSILTIQFDGLTMIAIQKESKRWVFKSAHKIDLLEKSENTFRIKIKDKQAVILSGQLSVDSLLKNKRFLTHSLPMSNQKGFKIGTLELQVRVVEKKQILDLMYSPLKLQNRKMQKPNFQADLIQLKQIPSNHSISSQPVLHMRKRYSLDAKNKNSTFLMSPSNLESREGSSRQKIEKNEKIHNYIKKRYQDIKLASPKNYLNELRSKDLNTSFERSNYLLDSPRFKQRSPRLSRIEKVDLKKPIKNQYHLPSIWERS